MLQPNQAQSRILHRFVMLMYYKFKKVFLAAAAIPILFFFHFNTARLCAQMLAEKKGVVYTDGLTNILFGFPQLSGLQLLQVLIVWYIGISLMANICKWGLHIIVIWRRCLMHLRNEMD